MSTSAVFDFGAFSPEADDGTDEPLSWRSDPATSLSDWVINVKRKGAEGGGKAYHIHRNVLAIGPRRSQYFVRLFVGNGGASAMSESLDQTTTLELEPSSVDSFAIYLDFVYTGALNATTLTATALLHLADYCGCRALYEATTAFMHADLRWQVAVTYLVEAELYSIDKVAAAALKLCAEHFREMDLTLNTLAPALFTRVVQSIDNTAASLAVSRRVAEYCRYQPPLVINRDVLASITRASRMPDVAPSDALQLLQLACEHQLVTEDDGGEPLVARCVNACSESWEGVLMPRLKMLKIPESASEAQPPAKRCRPSADLDIDDYRALLGAAIPDATQFQMYIRALTTASKDVNSQRLLLKDFELRVAELEEERDKALRDATEKQRQIQQFKRVPLTYTANNRISGTSLKALTYSPQNPSPYYGTEVPLVLAPGDSKEEGFVYAESIATPYGRHSAVYPMYYFS